MGLETPLTLVFGIMLIAFLCEYCDSTLGMGYGTTMTPVLMLFGFSPLQIVPAVLLSELCTGLAAAFFHSREGNVSFSLKNGGLVFILKEMKSIGIRQGMRTTLPLHLRVTATLVIGSILGASVSVISANFIPKKWVELYIGLMVLAMGVIIIVCFRKNFKFSWKKTASLGALASFNKGLTGGGYGPLIVSGQILSGIESKSAVGITSLAEGLTCIIGVFMYIFFSKSPVDWRLAPYIIAGALISTPISAKSVKRINPVVLKIAIAVLTIILGLITIWKTLVKYNFI